MSDDNEDFQPAFGRDDGEISRKARRKPSGDPVANWRKRGGQQNAPQQDFEGGAQDSLPPGTARQIEFLLGQRRLSTRRLATRLAIFVLLPTLIVWVYTALIATPRYVSTFEITYQAYMPAPTLAANLTQSDLGSSAMDSVDYGTLLYEYIGSEALAEKVDQQINLREHLSSRKVDALTRLSADANQTKLLGAWRSHVSVSEGFGGYLTVQVQDFDPEFSLLLAKTISTDADDMINSLSSQALVSQVKSATAQLFIASTLLNKADDALTVFRNAHGDLDPGFAATQLATIVGTLESELAVLRAQLQQAEANMQPGSSQIVQLKLQVAAMEQQIQSERQRLSDQTGTTYSNTVSQYNDLLSDQQFAATTYQSAQQGLIIAQANAQEKQNYAVDFVPPVLPDTATMPDPLISCLTTFLVFGALYGICNLLFAAFRDQSGI